MCEHPEHADTAPSQQVEGGALERKAISRNGAPRLSSVMAQEQVAAKGGPRGKPPTLDHLLRLASCAIYAIITPFASLVKWLLSP